MIEFFGTPLTRTGSHNVDANNPFSAIDIPGMLGISMDRAEIIARAAVKAQTTISETLIAQFERTAKMAQEGQAFDIKLLEPCGMQSLLECIDVDLETPSEILYVGMLAGRIYAEITQMLNEAVSTMSALEKVIASQR